MTIRDKIKDYLIDYPGRTSREINNGIMGHQGSITIILAEMVKDNTLIKEISSNGYEYYVNGIQT